jgi:signal transduction histidine kinase
MMEVNPAESLILNVDDYVPGRYARTKLLKHAGYQVVEAGSGREVYEVLQQKKPDLILLDVNLPDVNGFEICRQLRNNPQTAGTVILHISASSILTQHQVTGFESGADGYLVEPIEPAVLLATLNAFLRARKAEEALRKSNEELRWFAYRVGHDMNEPLRTITAYAQMLKLRLGADQQPEVTRFLDFIAEGAIKIRVFMDGLLQYSQAAASDSEQGPVECEALLARVLANLDSSIQTSGARITHDPLPTVAANEQLEYVFQNLISNAIKYARPGVTPEIDISARREDSHWLFSVQDNGVGIEPKFQERIFEVFHRLHGSNFPGNGIGLALARRIVDGLGGKIWVESQPGAGSSFYFLLPFEPVGAVSGAGP